MTLHVEWDADKVALNLKSTASHSMRQRVCFWFITVGLVDARPLAVAYTLRGPAIRIISAFPPERPHPMSNATTGKTVRFTLDPANPPTLSEATQARLDAMKDEDIDFSDISPSPADADWTCPGPLIPETKK